MIVTTASRPTEFQIHKGKCIADDLECNFIPRKNVPIKQMHKSYDVHDIVVVGTNRLQVFQFGSNEPLFFHPNSAMFRYKRLVSGQHDPLVSICELKEGMSFLDCTLGLGSDSIIASYVVGNSGKVVGVEINKIIAYLVKDGLQNWQSGNIKFDDAMQRINIIHSNYVDYLQSLPSNTYDIIYFDPMFDEQITSSDGIRNLRKYTQYTNLTKDVINEARRVCKHKVVLKDHFRSPRFKELGFHVIKRPSAKFHFAYL